MQLILPIVWLSFICGSANLALGILGPMPSSVAAVAAVGFINVGSPPRPELTGGNCDRTQPNSPPRIEQQSGSMEQGHDVGAGFGAPLQTKTLTVRRPGMSPAPDGDRNQDPVSPSDAKIGSQLDKDEHVNSLAEDRELFQFLLANKSAITRTVTELEDGVETVTESADPAIARKIQLHVASMHRRIEDARPIRMRDPLFRTIFQHAGKISMQVENIDRGVRVRETSDEPYAVKLIQAHAKVVSGFVEHGFDEARKNHLPPKQ